MLKLVIVAIIATVVTGGIAMFSLSFTTSHTLGTIGVEANRVPGTMPHRSSAVGRRVSSMATDGDFSTNDSDAPSKLAYPAGSPEAVVAAYTSASTWQERLPFVKHTHDIEDKMARYYGNNTIHFGYTRIVCPSKNGSSPGDVLEVHVISDSQNAFGQNVSTDVTYYLEKTERSYVILWEPSIGWLPIGWAAFKASRPTGITELQLRAKLTHNYFGISTKASVKHTYYELEMRPNDGNYHDPLVAYVAKKSSAGARLFEVLSDGRECPMVLGVQFRDRQGEECLWVREMVSDRGYVYDANMRRKYISPIEVAQPAAASNEAVPFRVSDISAQWAVNRDVLGGQVLVVPEVRFRVTAASSAPITSLRVKVVFLLSAEMGKGEVLYEDTQSVVSTNDRPLDTGFSKTVIFQSGKGYRVTGKNAATIAAIISGDETQAEIYYETDHGFTKLQAIPVTNRLSE